MPNFGPSRSARASDQPKLAATVTQFTITSLPTAYIHFAILQRAED